MRSTMMRLALVLTIAVMAGWPLAAPVGAQEQLQEQHNGATFLFDPGVSELDKYDVIEGIRLGQRTIASAFGIPTLPNLRITVFDASDDQDGTTLATTFGSEIEVYTGSAIWETLSPIERVETIVHELFHVYQNLMIEGATDVELLWFAEGTADAVGFQSVFPIGVTDQTEAYNLMSYLLSENPVTVPLAQLEGFASMDADAYPLAYMAVQYLLGSRGLTIAAIGDVYDGLAAGRTFAEAFQTTFGVTVSDFYAEFEAWRPGIAQAQELDDDFGPNDPIPTTSALTLDPAPAQVSSTGQLIVSGQTSPHVLCTLDLLAGNASVRRPAESNGEGEVFWLVSLPPGTAPGNGSLTASCGGSPVGAQFMIAA